MTHIEQMIKDMCPHGVEWKTLGELCKIRTGKLNANAQVENGKYPFFTCDANPYLIDTYAFDTEAILVSGNGSQVGHLNYYKGKFNAYQRTYVLDEFKEINIFFVLHYLKKSLRSYIMDKSKKGSVPYITLPMLTDFELPIPPVEIQKKIVECLDKFSALAAELQAELQARRKQYEFYRTQLLTPPQNISSVNSTDECNWEWKTLGEIAKYRRGSFPQPYGKQEWYNGEGAMPFVQVADVEEDSMLLKPATKQYISRLAMPMSVFVPEGTVIVSLQGSIGKVAITQYDSYVDRTLGIFESFKIDISKRYFAYQLKRIFAIKKEKARGGTIKTITKEEFTDFEIPIPSLQEQARIVAILDKFEALTTSLTDGIPAEQTAQQKRYEYYRDKLLTFDRKAV